MARLEAVGADLRAAAPRAGPDGISNGDGPSAGPPGVEYSGLVTRAIAIVIDAVLIDVVSFAVAGAVLLVESVFKISGKHHTLAVTIGTVLFIAWVVGYFLTFWTTTGQTPGSRVMQIRVARPDGKRIGPRRALIRLAWMALSLPLFWGYWPVLWTAQRRTVPDLVAGTVVTVAPSVPKLDRAGRARAVPVAPAGPTLQAGRESTLRAPSPDPGQTGS